MIGRVLLLPPGEAAGRAAVDWAAANLSDCRVVACGRPADARPIGRLAHPPFAPASPIAAAIAAEVAALLAADPDDDTARAVVEAAALAVVDSSPLVVSGSAPFKRLVPFSAWSMNVPSRPTDALVARHAAIAARAPGAILTSLAAATPPAAGPGLAEAFTRHDTKAIGVAVRARRLAARADGPIRFRRIAAKSAGLRPFALYLDLVPTLAERVTPAAELLERLEPERRAALLGMSIAIFL